MHIDGTWRPLRPGLVLHNPDRPTDEEFTQFLKVNDWEIVEAAQPQYTAATMPPFCFYRPWLSMNILCLDDRTVCVEESEVRQMDQLDRLGFEVVPVPFRQAYAFGGGLNCSTMDILRESTLEDYFPKRHGRF